MLTEYEAQKLQHEMRKELNAAPGVVFRCAAGLLIVVGLAMIGARTEIVNDSTTTASNAATQPGAPR